MKQSQRNEDNNIYTQHHKINETRATLTIYSPTPQSPWGLSNHGSCLRAFQSDACSIGKCVYSFSRSCLQPLPQPLLHHLSLVLDQMMPMPPEWLVRPLLQACSRQLQRVVTVVKGPGEVQQQLDEHLLLLPVTALAATPQASPLQERMSRAAVLEGSGQDYRYGIAPSACAPGTAPTWYMLFLPDGQFAASTATCHSKSSPYRRWNWEAHKRIARHVVQPWHVPLMAWRCCRQQRRTPAATKHTWGNECRTEQHNLHEETQRAQFMTSNVNTVILEIFVND